MHIFNTVVLALVTVSIYLKLVICEEIAVESSAIRCQGSRGTHNDQILNWHPTPVSMYEGEKLEIANHVENSALVQTIINDVKLRLVRDCKKKLVITLKVTDFDQVIIVKT